LRFTAILDFQPESPHWLFYQSADLSILGGDCFLGAGRCQCAGAWRLPPSPVVDDGAIKTCCWLISKNRDLGITYLQTTAGFDSKLVMLTQQT